MLKESRTMIDKYIVPVIKLIINNKWDKAEDLWLDRDCAFCYKFMRDDDCGQCPLLVRRRSCDTKDWYWALFDGIVKHDEFVIGNLLGLKMELEAL